VCEWGRGYLEREASGSFQAVKNINHRGHRGTERKSLTAKGAKNAKGSESWRTKSLATKDTKGAGQFLNHERGFGLMTRRRWIADEVSGNTAALTGTHAEHLARVLRARIGQEFDIAAGGEVRRGRVTSVSPERVEFELGEVVSELTVSDVVLILAIFKFDRMEWAIEKCTELGVARIVPVIAQRTEKHLASAADKRVERWRRIARQASEQSRRSVVAEVGDPVRLRDALATEAAAKIVLAEGEKAVTLNDALAAAEGSVALAIGPEGGWSEREMESFRGAGWVSASLGNNILRAETAAIGATAIVMAALQ
jgi:16S rRNA (uracil1498-N3)-methyltransferase